MLSFKKGTPIAYIKGGPYNGKTLHVRMDTDKPEISITDIFDVVSIDRIMNKSRKRYDAYDIDAVAKAFVTGKKPKSPEQQKIFHYIDSFVKDRVGKEFHIKKGELMQVPNTKIDRECLYIAGPSGSGKSTYVNNFIKMYKDEYPDNEVYLFSRVDEDPSLDDNEDIQRVIIDDELLDDPIDNEELEDSAVIFDDIDTIRDKELAEYVCDLRDDLLETGRHERVTMLCTSHLLMDYKKTRTLINESTSVTFFPRSGSTYHIIRFLKVYCGLNAEQINRILNLPSRWVTVSKIAPMWVLYGKGCFLI